MKTTLILAAAAGAMAQNLAGMPSCAVPCITSAVSQAGCAATDVACQCGPTQAQIAQIAGGCVLGACPASEINNVVSAGSALCVAYSSTAGSGASSTGSVVAPTTGTTTGSLTGTLSNSGTTMATVVPTIGTFTQTSTHGNGTVVTPTPSASSSGGGSGTQRPGSTSSTSTPNAAATPAVLGAGALVGLLGLVAAL